MGTIYSLFLSSLGNWWPNWWSLNVLRTSDNLDTGRKKIAFEEKFEKENPDNVSSRVTTMQWQTICPAIRHSSSPSNFWNIFHHGLLLRFGIHTLQSLKVSDCFCDCWISSICSPGLSSLKPSCPVLKSLAVFLAFLMSSFCSWLSLGCENNPGASSCIDCLDSFCVLFSASAGGLEPTSCEFEDMLAFSCFFFDFANLVLLFVFAVLSISFLSFKIEDVLDLSCSRAAFREVHWISFPDCKCTLSVYCSVRSVYFTQVQRLYRLWATVCIACSPSVLKTVSSVLMWAFPHKVKSSTKLWQSRWLSTKT